MPIKSRPPLTVEEEAHLVPLARAGNQAASSVILGALEGAVHQAARKHARRPGAPPLEDLVQEARTGVWKAIRSFDPGKGAKFVTFAVWKIRGELSWAGRRWKRIPEGKEDWLEELVGSDGVEERLVAVEARELVGQLAPLHYQVLQLRYGLGGTTAITMEEIAGQLGMSRKVVFSLAAEAMAELRAIVLRASGEDADDNCPAGDEAEADILPMIAHRRQPTAALAA